MKGVELSKLVITITCSLIILQKGGCVIFKDLLLCDQSSLVIFCPNETLISEINITSPKLITTLQDLVCSTSVFDTRNISFIEAIKKQCIGYRSCKLSSTDIEFTNISDHTWKINIYYACRFGTACLPKHGSWCAEIIFNRLTELCNGKQYCEETQKEDEEPKSDFNTCTRIPDYVYVSFTCSADAISTTPQSENLISGTLGITFGVSAGIVLVALLCFVLVKRLKAKGISISLTVTYKTTDHMKPSSVSVIEDIQDNYTTLEPKTDVSDYMKLDNAEPDFSVSKENIYMDVL